MVEMIEGTSFEMRKILRRSLTAKNLKKTNLEDGSGKEKERSKQGVKTPASPNYSKQENLLYE